MKAKRILSIILVVLVLLTQTVVAKDYSDYPQRFWDVSKDHWAYEYISELTDKGVISGYPDGSFKPENVVSRAEWSKLLVVASGKQLIALENNKSYAIDYNANDWYYSYINSVVDYMNFYNDGGSYYFKPNQSASREDVTVSLVKLKGYSVDNVDYSYISKFKDSNSISNNLKKYIAVAIEKELISGYEDNTFRGQDTLTRAEAATLLCRAFQLGNDNKTTNSNKVYLDGSEVNTGMNNEIKNEEGTVEEENESDDATYSHKDEYGLISDLILISVFQSGDDEYGIEVRNDEREKVRYSLAKNISIKRNGDKITLKDLKLGDELDILISYDEIVVNIQAYSSNSEKDNVSDDISKNEENNSSVVKENIDDVPEDIEENKLPYKIETLVKADIKNERYETGPINNITIRDDDIYYLEDNIVYVLDTNNKGYRKVMDINDTLNYDGKQYKITQIYNIFYDNNNDRVLMYCYADESDIFKGHLGFKFLLIDVEGNEIVNNEVSNGIIYRDILSVDEENNFWINKEGNISLALYEQVSYMNNSHYMSKEDIAKIGYSFDMKETNNNIYFLTNDGIYKYDYKEFKNILETAFNPIASFNNGFIIQSANGDFKKVGLKGEITDYINVADIEIKDKKSMISPKTIMNKMFINSNGEIIVYDLNNKCFRIISKNKEV